MNKIKRCPACKRTLQQAVNEQLDSKRICPLEYCAFKVEIRQAFLETKTPIDESIDSLPFISKYCSQCGKPYNDSTSHFCSYCGKERNKQIIRYNMKCSKCKTKNKPDAIYCINCSNLLRVIKAKEDKKHTIFISHAENDKKIVEDFCEMLRMILSPLGLGSHQFKYKIFCSSKIGCIVCGEDNNDAIHTHLNHCNNIFCILTKNSFKRPWVMYEIGYAKGKSSKKKVMPIAIGININRIKNGYPYSTFNIYECDEQHLSTLMIELLNNIVPNSCDGQEEVLQKSFAPHVKDFLKKQKIISKDE